MEVNADKALPHQLITRALERLNTPEGTSRARERDLDRMSG